MYAVTFDRASHIATVRPVFSDEAAARLGNVGRGRGKVVHPRLTDPDSNEVVPHSAARFGGAFMLTSQADQEQICLQWAGGSRRRGRLEGFRRGRKPSSQSW